MQNPIVTAQRSGQSPRAGPSWVDPHNPQSPARIACYEKCVFDKHHPRYYDYGRYYPRRRVQAYNASPSGYGWPSFKHSAYRAGFVNPYPQYQAADEFIKQYPHVRRDSMVPVNNWKIARTLAGDNSNWYPGACVMRSGNCIDRTSRWTCLDMLGGQKFVPYARCGFGI